MVVQKWLYFFIQEEEEEEEEYVEEEFEAGGQRGEGRPEDGGGQSLRAWPPMSDSQGMTQNKGQEFCHLEYMYYVVILLKMVCDSLRVLLSNSA